MEYRSNTFSLFVNDAFCIVLKSGNYSTTLFIEIVCQKFDAKNDLLQIRSFLIYTLESL